MNLTNIINGLLPIRMLSAQSQIAVRVRVTIIPKDSRSEDHFQWPSYSSLLAPPRRSSRSPRQLQWWSMMFASAVGSDFTSSWCTGSRYSSRSNISYRTRKASHSSHAQQRVDWRYIHELILMIPLSSRMGWRTYILPIPFLCEFTYLSFS